MVSTTFVLVIGFIYCANFANAVCKYGKLNSGLSKKEAQQIVDLHNNVRLKVAKGKLPGQPRGVDLKRMVWDDNLAKLGQDIANICEFKHKEVKDNRWWVGQNLATTWDSRADGAADWNKAVNLWIDEYKLYTYPNGFSSGTGHYTQVIWANSTQLGCGYTHFRTDGTWKYQKLYVCHYGPGGNYPRPPYKTGTSGCENLC